MILEKILLSTFHFQAWGSQALEKRTGHLNCFKASLMVSTLFKLRFRISFWLIWTLWGWRFAVLLNSIYPLIDIYPVFILSLTRPDYSSFQFSLSFSVYYNFEKKCMSKFVVDISIPVVDIALYAQATFVILGNQALYYRTCVLSTFKKL